MKPPPKVVLKPLAQRSKGFIEYDPIKAAQLKRQAMKESFGKSFSTTVEGGFKSLSLMTKAEREGIKGYHKAAHGMTDADRHIEQQFKNLRFVTANKEKLPHTRDFRGRKTHIAASPVPEGEEMSVGRYWATFPKPGETQRTAPGMVQLPRMERPDHVTQGMLDVTGHELAHRSVRKPASGLVRHFKYPAKRWGDEARANRLMSPKAQAKSDYTRAARGEYVSMNPHYEEGFKNGGKELYQNVTRKLESIGKRASAGKVVTLALRPKTALGIPITDPAKILATPKSVWAKGGLRVRQAPAIRFPVGKRKAS